MLVQDMMTKSPILVSYDDKIRDVAHVMRERNVGDVMVERNGRLCGIITDRDIVVRALGADQDISDLAVGEICSQNLFTVKPDDSIDTAVSQMRAHAVRRLPVMENGKCVGIVSLGDLALQKDPHSALGEISAAVPNL